MAKGQHLTRHQRAIVNRYYEHRDTIALNKLAEIVSELYLCTDPKKAERMWKSAGAALERAGANPAQLKKVLAERNVEHLARLLTELQASPK